MIKLPDHEIIGACIRVLPVKSVNPKFHNRLGRITALAGDIFPYAFDVLLEGGDRVVFLGSEIEKSASCSI